VSERLRIEPIGGVETAAELPENGSELILFDINRAARLRPFLASMHVTLLDELERDPRRTYRLTVITNDDETSTQVHAEVYEAGVTVPSLVPLNLSWPREVYSLSHVAMPFQPSDPWYGDGSGTPEGGFNLGTMQPRGERGMLRISVDDLMRLRHNPFFPYVEERLKSKTL